MSENVPLVLCVAAIWVAWSVHDYLQEAIFLTPGFDFPLTMALTLQSVASVLAFVQRSLSTALEPVAPADALTRRTFGWYLALSFLIASANGLSTAALSFVSMATKVLFKSSKIVVVMLIGAIGFGRRYSAASRVDGDRVRRPRRLLPRRLARPARRSSLAGCALLVGAVCVDAALPNVQQRLLQDLQRPKGEVVFHTNWISALLTLAAAVATGELGRALPFFRAHRATLALLLVQSAAGFGGILAYLECVRRFGSKATAVVTSCRKLFTILLSAAAFAHPLNGFHAIGAAAVVGGVLLDANAERAAARALLPLALALVAAAAAVQIAGAAPLPGAVESRRRQAGRRGGGARGGGGGGRGARRWRRRDRHGERGGDAGGGGGGGSGGGGTARVVARLVRGAPHAAAWGGCCGGAAAAAAERGNGARAHGRVRGKGAGGGGGGGGGERGRRRPPAGRGDRMRVPAAPSSMASERADLDGTRIDDFAAGAVGRAEATAAGGGLLRADGTFLQRLCVSCCKPHHQYIITACPTYSARRPSRAVARPPSRADSQSGRRWRRRSRARRRRRASPSTARAGARRA